ncbi:hypothetical protein OF83DRAFT_686449 [Amylostereum chailletii]|nr:hypothetical protein OF83DRAFT_686449 [Amylostereum chailletii]
MFNAQELLPLGSCCNPSRTPHLAYWVFSCCEGCRRSPRRRPDGSVSLRDIAKYHQCAAAQLLGTPWHASEDERSGLDEDVDDGSGTTDKTSPTRGRAPAPKSGSSHRVSSHSSSSAEAMCDDPWTAGDQDKSNKEKVGLLGATIKRTGMGKRGVKQPYMLGHGPHPISPGRSLYNNSLLGALMLQPTRDNPDDILFATFHKAHHPR